MQTLEPDGPNASRVVMGLVIAATGLVMLADRAGLAGMHVSGRYWPFIPLALGLARMIDPSRRPGRGTRPGLWLVWIGVWGLVSEFHVLGLDYDTSWPLLIVAAGIGMVWRAFDEPASAQDHSVQGS